MKQLLVILAAITAPLAASANMLHTPWLPALEQDGQDVVLTVAVFTEASVDELCGVAATPGIAAAYALVRTYPYDGGDDVVVFEDRVFDADDAAGTAICHSCEWSYPGECDEDPNGCVDCDDDSVPECPGFCLPALLFEVIDECVAPSTELVDPASVIYEIHESELGELGNNGLNVEDTGDECLEADADVDSDSDVDDGCGGDGDSSDDADDDPFGESSDDDSASCAVAGTGRPSDPSLVLVLLMLGIAGAALALGRRGIHR